MFVKKKILCIENLSFAPTRISRDHENPLILDRFVYHARTGDPSTGRMTSGVRAPACGTGRRPPCWGRECVRL